MDCATSVCSRSENVQGTKKFDFRIPFGLFVRFESFRSITELAFRFPSPSPRANVFALIETAIFSRFSPSGPFLAPFFSISQWEGFGTTDEPFLLFFFSSFFGQRSRYRFVSVISGWLSSKTARPLIERASKNVRLTRKCERTFENIYQFAAGSRPKPFPFFAEEGGKIRYYIDSAMFSKETVTRLVFAYAKIESRATFRSGCFSISDTPIKREDRFAASLSFSIALFPRKILRYELIIPSTTRSARFRSFPKIFHLRTRETVPEILRYL